MSQLHLASEAARADFRGSGQILKLWAVGDERVAGIFAFRDRTEVESFGKLKWDIFKAMDCNVDAAVEQRFIDFLGEEPLAANIRQRHIENFIASSFNGNELDAQARPMLFQFGLGPGRLPERKRASSRAKLELRHAGQPESNWERHGFHHCGGLILKILRRMST